MGFFWKPRHSCLRYIYAGRQVTHSYNADIRGTVTALLLDMNNTTNSTTVRGAKTIESVLSTRYGTSALVCDAITIEWAADFVAKTHGAAFAAKEWKRVNSRRRSLGKYTSIPQWGTALFAAYFA